MREELIGRAARLPLGLAAAMLLLRGTYVLAREQPWLAAACFAGGTVNLLAIVLFKQATARRVAPIYLLDVVLCALVALRDAQSTGDRALWILLAALFATTAALSLRRASISES